MLLKKWMRSLTIPHNTEKSTNITSFTIMLMDKKIPIQNNILLIYIKTVYFYQHTISPALSLNFKIVMKLFMKTLLTTLQDLINLKLNIFWNQDLKFYYSMDS
jgi:hypothetical protein